MIFIFSIICVVYGQQIVETNNKIQFFDKQSNQLLVEYNNTDLRGLRTWQKLDMYESNLTITSNTTLNGTSNNTVPGSTQLCYISDSPDNYQSFLSQCKNNVTDKNTVWILVSNSNSD
jgi:hypothetical protein